VLVLLLVIDLERKEDDYDHEHEFDYDWKGEIQSFTRSSARPPAKCVITEKGPIDMKLKERIEQIGATGYILLWLLGIPIPILFLFFLLRGCT